MSKQHDDGGPAFPAEIDSTQPYGRQVGNTAWKTYGMTLRDYFAAKALGSMRIENSDNPLYWDGVAKAVYACADAMLKARQP